MDMERKALKVEVRWRGEREKLVVKLSNHIEGFDPILLLQILAGRDSSIFDAFELISTGQGIGDPF